MTPITLFYNFYKLKTMVMVLWRWRPALHICTRNCKRILVCAEEGDQVNGKTKWQNTCNQTKSIHKQGTLLESLNIAMIPQPVTSYRVSLSLQHEVLGNFGGQASQSWKLMNLIRRRRPCFSQRGNILLPSDVFPVDYMFLKLLSQYQQIRRNAACLVWLDTSRTSNVVRQDPRNRKLVV